MDMTGWDTAAPCRHGHTDVVGHGGGIWRWQDGVEGDVARWRGLWVRHHHDAGVTRQGRRVTGERFPVSPHRFWEKAV